MYQSVDCCLILRTSSVCDAKPPRGSVFFRLFFCNFCSSLLKKWPQHGNLSSGQSSVRPGGSSGAFLFSFSFLISEQKSNNNPPALEPQWAAFCRRLRLFSWRNVCADTLHTRLSRVSCVRRRRNLKQQQKAKSKEQKKQKTKQSTRPDIVRVTRDANDFMKLKKEQG